MRATRLPRALLLVVVLSVLALAPPTGLPTVARAASLTFTVTSTVDAPDAHPGDGLCADAAGHCTLRAAIQEANAQPAGSAIGIAVPAGAYALSLGTLQLTANRIAITGALSSTTIITGATSSTVFAISSTVQAALRGLTVTGGNAQTGAGGGILNQGALVLRQSAVLNNTAPQTMGSGGGIANSGTLLVIQSTLSGNTAGSACDYNATGGGGGISNSGGGRLLVSQSTLSGNTTACGNGGGILNQGSLVLRQSAVLDNAASGPNVSVYGDNGGGIENTGTALVATSTINGNTASDEGIGAAGPGGGAGIDNSGTLTVIHSTLSGNDIAASFGGGVGGGINNNGRVTLIDSVLSGNVAVGGNGSGGSGGFSNNSGATVAVTNSLFSGNDGSYGGGFANFGMATVTHSLISDNAADTSGGGGGIENGGTLLVTQSTLSGNTAGSGDGGGGIDNYGTATVITSTLSGNDSTDGGGIDNDGVMTLTASTLSNNTSDHGGGIINDGMLAVVNSTFSGNAAINGDGGGMYNENGGTLTATNSTFSGNTASSGGAIFNAATVGVSSTVRLSYVSVAFNTTGISTQAGAATVLTGTIVAESTNFLNCDGVPSDGGYNLDSGATCGFSQPTDLNYTNPLLGPLAYNGGPTQTMSLLPGSPAIDHGATPAAGCPTTDQRDYGRPDRNEARCDMGAYETGAAPSR